MKILVIFTGGTIGSTVSGGTVAPDKATEYALINEFRKASCLEVEIDTISPYTILSENISEKELTILIKCVSENLKCGYDGIIVTHGTDTLQYTASALSFSLGNCTPPVVMVSSNYPIENKKANGIDNFIAAVEFIHKKAGTGVFVSYKNGSSPVCIFRGSRIFTHGEMTDEINCVGGEPYAFFDSEIRLNPAYVSSVWGKPVGNVDFCRKNGILAVMSRPGDAWEYDLSHCKAVLIKPYHSGTLNTENEFFAEFCNKAKSNNIPIFVVNTTDGDAYISTEKYNELGITELPFSSFAAVYMKIWIAVSIGADISAFVRTIIAEEFLISEGESE